MPYSQNSEEETILAYFGDSRGRFADFGSFGFKELSNTRRLAELGWGGVLVEADPVAFAGMLREVETVRAGYPEGHAPDIMPVCAAVMPEPGMTHFWIGGGVSTASEAHRKLWAEHAAYKEIWVAAVTPAQLLEALPGPFDLLSLDIEGCNLAILEQLPLYDMGVRCAVIEHEGEQERIAELCAQFGLTECIGSNAENLILARPRG